MLMDEKSEVNKHGNYFLVIFLAIVVVSMGYRVDFSLCVFR